MSTLTNEFTCCVSRVKIDMPVFNYVYIVRCADGTLYTGWTNNLDERIKTHNEGTGAKYTRSRLPVALVYQETFDDKKTALKREFAIKKLTKAQKEKLIRPEADVRLPSI